MVNTIFGAVAVAIASTKRAPARMMPLCSASAPTMKPETSWTKSSGVQWRLQLSMKYAVFAGGPADHFFREIDLELVKCVRVEKGVEHRTHVIWSAVVVR